MARSIRIPLAEPLTNRDNTASKDSKLVNCFVEDVGGHPEVIKRPGALLNSQLNIGIGQGIFTYDNILYGITNDVLVGNPGATLVADGTVWTNNAPTGNPFPSAWITVNGSSSFYNHCQGPDGLYILYGSFKNGTTDLFLYKTTDGIAWTKTLCTVDTTTGNGIVHSGNMIYWNGYFWLFGGNDATLGVGTKYNCIYRSLDGFTWTLVTASAPWTARYKSTVAVHNNFIYLIGGYGENDVWKMNTNTGLNWSLSAATTGAPSLLGNDYHSAGSYNGYLWYVQGQGDVRRSADGITWTQVTATSGFTSLALTNAYTTLCVYGNKMWVLDSNGAGGRALKNSADGITWSTVLASVPMTLSGDPSLTGVFVFGSTMAILDNLAPDHLWTGVINASTGQSYPMTNTVANLTFDFSLAQTAAGQFGFFFKSTKDAYFFNNLTLTKVTSANYPATTVPGVVYIDGTYYVGTANGQIFGSAIEDPLTWSALNYVSAEVEPDGLVAIVKNLNYLVALGAWSTEFFYDAGNPTGSPLSSVPNAFFNIGCASGSSVSRVDNSVIWMSQTRQRGRQIVMLNGFNPEVISTSEIDRILNADSLSTVYSFSIRTNGSTFYVLTLKASNKTLVYDLSTKQWHFWSSMVPQTANSVTSITSANGVATVTQTAHGFADGDVVLVAGASQTAYNGFKNITYVDANTYTFPVAVGTVSPATGTITAQGYTEQYFNGVSYSYATGADYIQGETDGKVYAMDPVYGDDNGNYINMKIRTLRIDGGNAVRKFIRKAELIGDKVAATAFLRYTDDDYQTYTPYMPMDMSASRTIASRLGHTRRRAFEVRITDNFPIRVSYLELDMYEGVS